MAANACQGYYEVGSSYFWVAAHCDFVMRFATPLLRERNTSGAVAILDAGCGYGSLLDRLAGMGKVVGLDSSPEACSFCRKKHGVEIIQGDVEKMPFGDDAFDVIFALETLEHIENNARALEELHRVLKPGGVLMATVPAFPCLWGYHDEKYGHKMRYTKSTFSAAVHRAGFVVRELRYFKFFLFVPLWILRRLKKIFGRRTDDFYRINPALNRFLRRLLSADNFLVSKISLPVGANLFAILSKR